MAWDGSAPIRLQWPGPSLVFPPAAEAMAPLIPPERMPAPGQDLVTVVTVVMLIFPTLSINYTQKLVDHRILNSTWPSTALRSLEPSEVLGKCPKIAKMCSNFFFLMFWKTLVATEEMETRFSYKIY